MALKPHRQITTQDIEYFVLSITGPNSTRMEEGGILCAGNGSVASGAALDSSTRFAEYVTNPSGYQALGVLMNSFVNIDLSRQMPNPYNGESQIGNKATITTLGRVTTNMIDSTSATGSVPAVAYAGPSGLFTQTNPGGYPTVGRFLTRKDADGYAEVSVNLNP